jgi:NADH dehydrogenase/NADH:ubiquinone oxidoreductase subunit G
MFVSRHRAVWGRVTVGAEAGRMVRLGETHRAPIEIEIDGKPVQALQGDTLLVAILTHGGRLRISEFGDGPRAGFCLMGACQDCWVWTVEGGRLQACSTMAENGMRVVTNAPEAQWPPRA